MQTKVLLVDDHPTITEAIKYYLGEEYEVFEAQNASEMRAQFERQRFEAVVLDLDLKGGPSGYELISEIQQQGSKVVVYTGTCDLSGFRFCLEANVNGFMDKCEPARKVPKLVADVIAGYRILPDNLLTAAFGRKEDQLPRLSHRQAEVLNMIFQVPLPQNIDIAIALDLSKGRISNIMTELFEKFCVDDRHSLLSEARRRGYRPNLSLGIQRKKGRNIA